MTEALKVLQVLQGIRELLDQQGILVTRDYQATGVRRDLQDLLELLDQQEQQGHQGLLAPLEG